MVPCTISAASNSKSQEVEKIPEIPPEGIVIKKSGLYFFDKDKDITWKPTNQSCAAITILANNVELDMKGRYLKVNTENIEKDKEIIGISIIGGNTVSIKNGTITNISFYGVNFESVTNLLIDNITIDGMTYENTNTPYATPSGIFINKSESITINNCKIQNVNVKSASSAGIQIVESRNGKVLNCSLQNFFNKDGAVQGYSYLSCSAIITNNCNASKFKSEYLGITKTTGHTVIGFIPIFCYKLTYENCSATVLNGCCDDCHGMSVFLDEGITVNNFTAKNIIDGEFTKKGAKATGIEVYGVNVTINQCKAEAVYATMPGDRQSAGYSAWGRSIIFNECEAKDVKVKNKEGENNTDFGFGVGFGWAPDPRIPFRGVGAYLVEYNNCNSIDCQVGFDSWYHVSSKWKSFRVENCQVEILNEPVGAIREFTIDKCSELDMGVYATVQIENFAEDNIFIPL